MLKLLELPSQFKIKKTSSGYLYEPDMNVKCNFKGIEPSPKGFGLCARIVLEGEHAKGTDGNIWVKKGGRWVKDNIYIKSKKSIKMYHTPVKVKKQTKSEALKLHNEVYKVWNKVAKKSKKRYGAEDYLISHPDGPEWGYSTSQKYLDYEDCISNSKPKRECNKLVTMLKKDLTKINKALEKVKKPVKKLVKKPVSKKLEIKKYILKEGVEDTKTYELNLVLLKKIKSKGLRSNETTIYFKLIGKYPKFLLDYKFGDSLLIANKNSIAFDKRMYIGDVDYILEEVSKKTHVKSKENNLSNYSSLMEWRKISPLGKKFNKMILKFNNGSKWDYKLAEQYNLEEKRMEKKIYKPVKVKKLVKSEALKIHNEIYKIWDNLASKSMKLHRYKEYFVPNPQFHNISKEKSFKHNIKTNNDNGFSLDCACGPNTGDKYLYYESCISKSFPKKECNKHIKLLKKDLSNIQKALELSKKTNKLIVKTTPVKSKVKKTLVKSKVKLDLKDSKELNDEIYKTWNKISKISKKLYNNKNRIEFHPDYDGLGGWSYPTKYKYIDLKKCITNSHPKRECNKIKKLLKEDLSLMERTLKRSIKLQDKMLKAKKTIK